MNTTCTDCEKPSKDHSYDLDYRLIAECEKHTSSGKGSSHTIAQRLHRYRLSHEVLQDEVTPRYATEFLDSEHWLRSFVRNRNIAFMVA